MPGENIPHAASLTRSLERAKHTGRRAAPDLGMARSSCGADDSAMIWPVAALAVFLLGFVVFYGSVLQSRLGMSGGRVTRRARAESDD